MPDQSLRRSTLSMMSNCCFSLTWEHMRLVQDLKKTPEEVWPTETGLLLQEINHILKHLKQWMLPERVATEFAQSSFH